MMDRTPEEYLAETRAAGCIPTTAGVVHVTLQNGRTALVQAGVGNLGTYEERRAGESDRPGCRPLSFGRGATGELHGHWKLTDGGGWSAARNGWLSLRRTDGRDATPTQREHVAQAVAVALGEQITAEQLTEAQRAANAEEAAERRQQAAGARRIAEQLDAMAAALETSTDARTVYVKQRLRSGSEQSAKAVRTAAGKLLFVDEPLSGERVYGMRRWADESADWIEEA